MDQFRQNLIWLRKTTKLSQEKFGEIFSLTRGQMDSYERKNHLPSIEDANKICRYFDITLDNLFNESIEEVLLRKVPGSGKNDQTELITELKRDKEDLRERNKELKEKIKELEKQISALKNKLPADPLMKGQKASH